MTHKFGLILFLWLLFISPQLAACAELSPYPVKDSGLFSPDTAYITWLDNSRVLFYGYTGVEYAPDDPKKPDAPKKIVRFREAGYYVWDIKKETVRRDASLNGRSKICIQGDYWSYIQPSKENDKEFLLVSGKKGEETERPYPKVHWFNPHSCRYYDTKPFWVIEGHRTVPLLEEHGYLDLGSVIPPQPDPLTLRFENPNPAVSFYSAQAKNKFPLPIGWQEVGFIQVHYAPFSNRYLLSGLQYV